MKSILTTISVAFVFILSLASANAGSLTVYTAIEAEDLKRYADEWFEIQKNIKSKNLNKNKNYDKRRKRK